MQLKFLIDSHCTAETPPGDDAGEVGFCDDVFELFCTIETFRGCSTDEDCPHAGDTCVSGRFRKCYTDDDGAVGGSISAPGVADPPVDNTAHPTLGAVFCTQPLTAGVFNGEYGLPGPSRFTIPGTVTLAHKIVSGTLPLGGGMVLTDTEGDGATTFDPLEAAVTSPNAGEVIIAPQATTAAPPPGFTFLGEQATIIAAAAGPGAALVLEFRLDSSRITPGENENTIVLFKDGAQVAECVGPGATPDPCVATRALLADGDVALTVHSSTASEWNFAAVVATPTSAPTATPSAAATATPEATATAAATSTAVVTPAPTASPTPTALELTSAQLRAARRGGTNGRIAAQGTFDVDPAGTDFDASAPITARVTDALAVDMAHTWASAECTTTEIRSRRRIVCLSADRLARVEFIIRTRTPDVAHFRLALKRLTLSTPFAAPLVLTLTSGSPATSRAGTIATCRAPRSALSCR